VAELKTGGVDIVRSLPPDLMPDLTANPNTYVSTAPILRTHYTALDMRHPPFDKKEARQAANYAIDRQAIIEKLMGGLGKLVPTVINPMAFGYDRASNPTATIQRKRKNYSNRRAIQMVSISHCTRGPLRHGIVSSPKHLPRCSQRSAYERTSRFGIRDLLGISSSREKAKRRMASSAAGVLLDVRRRCYPASALPHRTRGWVGKWYARVTGLDQLIDDARSTVDRDKRLTTYAKIQRLIQEEAPSIFLYHQFDMLGINKRVVYEARGDEWIWVYDAKLRK
jgi:peptide/nickel transport system substrate-binding protein